MRHFLGGFRSMLKLFFVVISFWDNECVHGVHYDSIFSVAAVVDGYWSIA